MKMKKLQLHLILLKSQFYLNIGMISLIMKENKKMAKLREKVRLYIQMEIYMKENGSKIWRMDLENILDNAGLIT